MGFDQTGSASRLVKRVFDPFLDECDRNVLTHTASEGHATVGKKPGDAPGDSPSPSSRYGL